MRWLRASSWVAFAGHTIKEEYDSVTSTFVVPPAPHDPKYITTLFFFNGLQDQPSGGGATYILQPVLQYGKSGCGGGGYWSIAAFYVSASGRAYCGKTYKVHQGDVINANMTKSEDGQWTVVAEDVTNNQVSSYTAEQVTTPAIYACITMEGIVVYVLPINTNSVPTNAVRSFAFVVEQVQLWRVPRRGRARLRRQPARGRRQGPGEGGLGRLHQEGRVRAGRPR